MIPLSNAAIVAKFSERRWIDQIIDGNLSFSCAGNFIHQAKVSGNTVQGDMYEAVFARLPKADTRIDEMKIHLGNDLEIMDQGSHVLLRRKSAKLIPMFCFYAPTLEDILEQNDINQTGKQILKYMIDPQMFSGFSTHSVSNVLVENHKPTILVTQAKPFVDRIKIGMINSNDQYEMHQIQTISIYEGEFFIEPTNKYLELGWKDEAYKVQREARVWLPNVKFMTIFDRLNISVLPLDAKDYRLTTEEFFAEFVVQVAKESSL